MKILKIFLILLVPAFGFVGCQKSNMKPSCQGHETNAPEAASKASDDNGSNDNQPQSRNASPEENVDGDENTTDIIGSGDDDRDGGDKKKKLTK
jgi:hypothetical protein